MSRQSPDVSRQKLGPVALDEAVEHPADLPRTIEQLGVTEQPACESAFEPVLRLSCRSARDHQEPHTVGVGFSPKTLGEVCTDRIRGPLELNAERPTVERPPPEDAATKVVGDVDRVSVDTELRDVAHVLVRIEPLVSLPLATGDWRLETGA
jgi:hypothetical protein